jgi:3-oxoacyl-[acyl-carrier-protein] synthase II
VDRPYPHGACPRRGLAREAAAITGVLPERQRALGSSEAMSLTGHLMGAAGAVEGIFTVLSVHHQMAPATLNYLEPDPEIELDVVRGE